jgi:hypothetical protein
MWADEFDEGRQPNPADWKLEQVFMRNEELRCYQRHNALIENGALVIEARRERRSNPNYDALPDDWEDEFHIWRMDWSELSIELCVDDQLLNQIDVERAANPPGTLPRYRFRQPQ